MTTQILNIKSCQGEKHTHTHTHTHTHKKKATYDLFITGDRHPFDYFAGGVAYFCGRGQGHAAGDGVRGVRGCDGGRAMRRIEERQRQMDEENTAKKQTRSREKKRRE